MEGLGDYEKGRVRKPGSLHAGLSRLCAYDGSAAHAYYTELVTDVAEPDSADFADLAHFLCLLHGRFPGVIDHALGHSAADSMRNWLIEAGNAFVAERALLTRLTVAAGPIASTAGHDLCNAAVSEARQALETLAQSDRKGCAFGAAYALVNEWTCMRKILHRIAVRCDVPARPSTLPDTGNTHIMLDAFSRNLPLTRAITFGVAQMLAQHRALWDLLQARRDSRHALLG